MFNKLDAINVPTILSNGTAVPKTNSSHMTEMVELTSSSKRGNHNEGQLNDDTQSSTRPRLLLHHSLARSATCVVCSLLERASLCESSLPATVVSIDIGVGGGADELFCRGKENRLALLAKNEPMPVPTRRWPSWHRWLLCASRNARRRDLSFLNRLWRCRACGSGRSASAFALNFVLASLSNRGGIPSGRRRIGPNGSGTG